MIFLFLNGQVSILRSKVPKQIENNLIHTKEGIIAKFVEDCYKISDIYADDFRKLKQQHNFSQIAKYNYKYLIQLEFIGDVYQILTRDKYDRYDDYLNVN